MKSKEEILDKYLKDNHGPAETYRDILKAMKEYAQQSQPSGMRWVMDEIAFLEECVRITKEGDWSTIFVKPMQDRIAKLKDFLSESSPAGAAEGASEGMAEALRKKIKGMTLYMTQNMPITEADKISAARCEAYNIALQDVLSALASLSPGVEDGSGWVKVEDRLPENAGWVNDTVMFWSKKHGHALIGCYDFEFDDWTQQPWTEGAEKLKSSDVTHWRPLPTPPDVEDNQTKKQ